MTGLNRYNGFGRLFPRAIPPWAIGRVGSVNKNEELLTAMSRCHVWNKGNPEPRSRDIRRISRHFTVISSEVHLKVAEFKDHASYTFNEHLTVRPRTCRKKKVSGKKVPDSRAASRDRKRDQEDAEGSRIRGGTDARRTTNIKLTSWKPKSETL